MRWSDVTSGPATPTPWICGSPGGDDPCSKARLRCWSTEATLFISALKSGISVTCCGGAGCVVRVAIGRCGDDRDPLRTPRCRRAWRRRAVSSEAADAAARLTCRLHRDGLAEPAPPALRGVQVGLLFQRVQERLPRDAGVVAFLSRQQRDETWRPGPASAE